MRDLVEALVMSHALTLLAMAAATLGVWQTVIVAVPAICCAVFLTYVAAIDAAQDL